jgi:hypothetical protein
MPSCARFWTICRRKRKSVSSQGELFGRGSAIFTTWLPAIEPFPLLSATSAKVGNVPSAEIGYNLILARPMPPPSIGKASFMRGHCNHRTNCSSTKHKEGL